MPQVSRRPIKTKLAERMAELLEKSFAKLSRQKDVNVFLQDFLTPTEKIMLAKRVAIALLLSRGWDHDAICRYLKVSTSTVTTIKNKLKTGSSGYKKVIEQIETDSEWEQIWLDLQQGLEEIIAGRVGANWKTSKAEVHHKFRSKREKYRVL